MSSLGYERRKAVANAWKNEKSLVVEGKGTRDWSQKEQREIISVGKATGYQGHHMKSVDGHNSKAGDANNIQFLTRKEHLAAHKGDFHNNTNGYYDPASGKMYDFGRNKASIESKKLNNPLSESQRKAAMSKTGSIKKVEAAKEKAKVSESRNMTHKSSEPKRYNSSSGTQSKTLSNQRASAPAKESNTAVKSKTLSAQRSKSSSQSTSSKTLSAQRNNSSPGYSSGKNISAGKSASSGKSTSGGKSSSSGKSVSHGH